MPRQLLVCKPCREIPTLPWSLSQTAILPQRSLLPPVLRLRLEQATVRELPSPLSKIICRSTSSTHWSSPTSCLCRLFSRKLVSSNRSFERYQQKSTALFAKNEQASVDRHHHKLVLLAHGPSSVRERQRRQQSDQTHDRQQINPNQVVSYSLVPPTPPTLPNYHSRMKPTC